MIHATIRIQSKADAKNGMAVIEGLKPETTVTAELKTFGILEGGMASGKTSIMFHFKLPDGRDVIVETSAGIFEGFAAALRGAEQRFESEKAKKN